MRKVIYGGACSLDGYLTDRDGKIDWLHFSKDVEQIMARSWANTDTILLGRKTWEAAAAQGGGGGSMPGVKAYIFSRTLTAAPKGAPFGCNRRSRTQHPSGVARRRHAGVSRSRCAAEARAVRVPST